MRRTTPEEGGETVFPVAPPETRVSGPQWSACAQQGLAVKPKRGDALLFYRHAACHRGPRARSAGLLASAAAGSLQRRT